MGDTSTKLSPLVERLNKAYLRLKVDQSQFAEMLGISRQYASAILNDKKGLGEPVLRALATKGVNVNWLLTGDGPMLATQGRGAPEQASGVGWVPHYSVKLGAGIERAVTDEPPEDFTPYGEEELKRLTSNPQNLVELEVEGESMQPTFVPGERVLVDMTKGRTVKDGIWAIRIREGLLIKRIQVFPSGGIRIISDNPLYPPQEIAPEGEDGFALVGRVLMVAKRL